jgi:AraC-like DNA-binding protein
MTARDDRFEDKRTKAGWSAGPWPGNRTAMPARMKDIAHDLGVSVVTVSRAFRNVTDINPETRARVLRRAEELHYNPNLAARALATGRTGLVGLVVPDLVHSFFAEIAAKALVWSWHRRKKTRNWNGKKFITCWPEGSTFC